MFVFVIPILLLVALPKGFRSSSVDNIKKFDKLKIRRKFTEVIRVLLEC